jgi:hypothetical protein
VKIEQKSEKEIIIENLYKEQLNINTQQGVKMDILHH